MCLDPFFFSHFYFEVTSHFVNTTSKSCYLWLESDSSSSHLTIVQCLWCKENYLQSFISSMEMYDIQATLFLALFCKRWKSSEQLYRCCMLLRLLWPKAWTSDCCVFTTRVLHTQKHQALPAALMQMNTKHLTVGHCGRLDHRLVVGLTVGTSLTTTVWLKCEADI